MTSSIGWGRGFGAENVLYSGCLVSTGVLSNDA